ncbi:MFS transporter [Caldisalinibacter kiritimatiensis]|uniref:Major facilitator superfamily (MFS) profile domain-containing protein n=1 Tax=Caldisalinibacter kiritimatiensis TaxID=1304284 RepID=R1AS01_9FIRM|nr:MFS transporter [Caldisalinibacter kiritimatiensis]EOC99917.1 hypothetical protein L21TH_2028 [Caldisalinibacter kiritimatiensis]
MKKNKHILAIGFIFIIMILMAMTDNTRGVFIPEFKKAFQVEDTQMGIMIAACSLGYIISTYVGGILCEKVGQKKVMLTGFVFAIFSLLNLYISQNFIMLLAGLFFLNVGTSLMAIGINTLIPVLAVSFQAVLMNMIHFCYGAGATITQRAAGILLFSGVTWRNIYLMIGFLFLITLIGFILVKIPEPDKVEKDEKIDNKAIFKNKLVYFYMLALGLYVSAELATGNWFINFLKEVYKFNDNKSTFYSALFFGIFTVGRFLGGFVVEKFGRVKSVLVSLCISFIFYTSGLILGKDGVMIISISGLFFGIVFPTLVLTVSSVFKKNSAYITGIIITAASTINMIMNLIIGWLNDLIGIYTTYYLIPISLLVSALFTLLIYKNTKSILEN